MDNQQFNDAYWASKAPEVQALRNAGPERANMAAELSGKGFTIDVDIMVWGWSPWLVMTARQQYGLPWVPSYSQPNIESALSKAPTDMTHPWPGSIPTSTNLADYPPFVPPPAPVVPSHDAVGAPGAFGEGTFSVDVQGAFVNGRPIFKAGDVIPHDGQPLYYVARPGTWGLEQRMWMTAAKWASFQATGTI
jgi:hypothetical protein